MNLVVFELKRFEILVFFSFFLDESVVLIEMIDFGLLLIVNYVGYCEVSVFNEVRLVIGRFLYCVMVSLLVKRDVEDLK